MINRKLKYYVLLLFIVSFLPKIEAQDTVKIALFAPENTFSLSLIEKKIYSLVDVNSLLTEKNVLNINDFLLVKEIKDTSLVAFKNIGLIKSSNHQRTKAEIAFLLKLKEQLLGYKHFLQVNIQSFQDFVEYQFILYPVKFMSKEEAREACKKAKTCKDDKVCKEASNLISKIKKKDILEQGEKKELQIDFEKFEKKNKGCIECLVNQEIQLLDVSQKTFTTRIFKTDEDITTIEREIENALKELFPEAHAVPRAKISVVKEKRQTLNTVNVVVGDVLHLDAFYTMDKDTPREFLTYQWRKIPRKGSLPNENLKVEGKGITCEVTANKAGTFQVELKVFDGVIVQARYSLNTEVKDSLNEQAKGFLNKKAEDSLYTQLCAKTRDSLKAQARDTSLSLQIRDSLKAQAKDILYAQIRDSLYTKARNSLNAQTSATLTIIAHERPNITITPSRLESYYVQNLLHNDDWYINEWDKVRITSNTGLEKPEINIDSTANDSTAVFFQWKRNFTITTDINALRINDITDTTKIKLNPEKVKKSWIKRILNINSLSKDYTKTMAEIKNDPEFKDTTKIIYNNGINDTIKVVIEELREALNKYDTKGATLSETFEYKNVKLNENFLLKSTFPSKNISTNLALHVSHKVYYPYYFDLSWTHSDIEIDTSLFGTKNRLAWNEPKLGINFRITKRLDIGLGGILKRATNEKSDGRIYKLASLGEINATYSIQKRNASMGLTVFGKIYQIEEPQRDFTQMVVGARAQITIDMFQGLSAVFLNINLVSKPIGSNLFTRYTEWWGVGCRIFIPN